jgi:hypothetical protein
MFHFGQRLGKTLFLNTLQNTKSDQSSNPLCCDDTSYSHQWQITDLDHWEDTEKWLARAFAALKRDLTSYTVTSFA